MSYSDSDFPVLRTLNRLRAAFWRRRVMRWWVRALWLALLVPTIVMAGFLWSGWQISWHIWLSAMLLVGIVSILWSLRPIDIKTMTGRLDRLLALRAQLITAFEVSQQAEQSAAELDNPVAEQLVQDTVNITVDLRRQVKLFGRGFWLEIHALIAVAALLGALLLFDVLRPDIPQASALNLPPAGQEPRADEVIPPDPTLQQQPNQPQPMSEAQVRDILQILADALRDQAVTFSIAEALDRDDLEGAAEELRRLADQLDELSRQAHQELGDSLQDAANEIGDEAPNITEPLQRGKQGLDINNLTGASRALEDLAEVLEDLDETRPESNEAESGGEPEESGDTEPNEAEEAGGTEGGAGDGAGEAGTGNQPLDEEEERLPIDGQPLELESDLETEDRVLQPAELDAQAGDERALDSPFTRQPLNAAGDDLGPDPLTYPWEKRDIIREYFTP